MTTQIQGIIQNPDLLKEHLRLMSRGIADVINFANRGFREEVGSISTGATVTADNNTSIYYVNATDGIVTFNMPALEDVQGRLITVKKIDIVANDVVVTPASTNDTIDGATTKPISSQYDAFRFHASTEWFIV